MSSKIEDLIVTLRGSVIGQLNSANSLYDLVSEISRTADELPEEYSQIKIQLQNDALKLYQEASAISEAVSPSDGFKVPSASHSCSNFMSSARRFSIAGWVENRLSIPWPVNGLTMNI